MLACFGNSSSPLLVAQSVKFRDFLEVAVPRSQNISPREASIRIRPATLERVLTVICHISVSVRGVQTVQPNIDGEVNV